MAVPTSDASVFYDYTKIARWSRRREGSVRGREEGEGGGGDGGKERKKDKEKE